MHLNEVIWPNEYLLTAVGLWPINSNANLSVRLFAYARTVVGICSVLGMLVPHIMTVAVNWGDLKILGELGSLIIPHFILLLKMLYLSLHRPNFASLYQCVKDFWDANVDSKDRQHYERLANIGKIVTIICLLSTVADLICYEAIAVINLLSDPREINGSISHRPFPMELYYGFDTQPTPIYELVFMWQNICLIFIICAIIGCDCTVMVFVVHVSARFRQLAKRFVTSIGLEIKERNNSERELRADFQQFVAQHQHVIRVANEMNELLSPMVFGQIMSSGVLICLSGYALIEGETSGLELFKFLVLFIMLLLQLGVWCVPAELLIQESTGVADIIYFEVPWYKLSPGQRRDLAFVIMRAQKDCHVSALYKVMCVMRLTEVFNAAGSYMALLRSMKE